MAGAVSGMKEAGVRQEAKTAVCALIWGDSDEVRLDTGAAVGGIQDYQ